MLFTGFILISFIGSYAPHAATRSPILYLLLWCTTKEHPAPLLFLVFINDLQLTVVNLCSVSLYTVHTDAVLFCNYSNIKDLKNALNEDLSKIALWLNRNKLTLNI